MVIAGSASGIHLKHGTWSFIACQPAANIKYKFSEAFECIACILYSIYIRFCSLMNCRSSLTNGIAIVYMLLANWNIFPENLSESEFIIENSYDAEIVLLIVFLYVSACV